ncbi:MAG: hypothetical protein HY077_01470 [Elusimicrobia bacterium]|nr:hypothetical protein [Elusimicrobiota bacterium]
MRSKSTRARAAKPAVRRKAAKKPAPPSEITAEEVVSLELEAARHTRSERAWLSMTAAPRPNEEDHWSGVEEHLLNKGLQESESERRWKYFAK